MRLNLGCGHAKMKGFTNVDRNYYCNPDVVADVERLPYDDNTIDEIYASHILEHFDYRSKVLEEWHRVLRPGGLITVIVPDVLKIYDGWKKGHVWGSMLAPKKIDRAYVNATVFGAHLLGPDWTAASHTHKQIFFYDMLLETMKPYFPDAHQVDTDRYWAEDVPRNDTVVEGTK
jgi:ubiquinone/menaquinone biosynthesis C-methylase UbiE